MGLEKYRTLILVITAVSALILATPALQQLVVEPQTDRLTEMGLLGANHTATYPSNITSGQNFRLYLDITNHLGSAAYYEVQIKFRDQGQSGPNSFNHTNSDLPAIGTLTMVAADNQTAELPLDITFHYGDIGGAIAVQDITINGATLQPDPATLTYNSDRGGYFGNLFFELYIYNGTSNSFQYHERYNSLWLKLNP